MKSIVAGVASFVLLFLLRIDFWLWDDARLVLGLPIGLFYHIVYCFIVSGVMVFLSRRFWPGHLEDE
ncbi:MAG: DUF3311 domain-containing protein [bacterium]